ncbi:MAG: hypothetical protein E7242_05845 [Lachnospiraceae bacterium]|nr:hypothetical protein [Lachnospiraceae bacterium]
MMLSEDWKERFKAEYYQTKIRHEKLEKMLFDWDNLSFEPKCPKELLSRQFETMNQLLDIYEERAKIEEIAL